MEIEPTIIQDLIKMQLQMISDAYDREEPAEHIEKLKDGLRMLYEIKGAIQ